MKIVNLKKEGTMKFEIEQEMLNKIIRYLATKPYAEVAPLISELNQNIKPIEEKIENGQEELHG
jgi:hypothetical protein